MKVYRNTITLRSYCNLRCADGAIALITASLIVLALGCSKVSDVQDLSGRVTLADGSPLARTRVIFRSKESGNFSARTDSDGNYTAGSLSEGAGIKSGVYSVTLMEDRGDTDHPMPPKINAKYNLVRSSGLQVTVPAEGERFDIVLDPPDS